MFWNWLIWQVHSMKMKRNKRTQYLYWYGLLLKKGGMNVVNFDYFNEPSAIFLYYRQLNKMKNERNA
jgi:hypothetical protein